jgi:hypothetical protein
MKPQIAEGDSIAPSANVVVKKSILDALLTLGRVMRRSVRILGRSRHALDVDRRRQRLRPELDPGAALLPRLDVGGFRSRTLPSRDDLQALVGGSTAGKRAGEGWALDFGDGGRASVAAGDSGLNRALCVRSAERRNREKK